MLKGSGTIVELKRTEFLMISVGNVVTVQSVSTISTGQKRVGDDHGAPASKKAHMVDSEEIVQVKVLIPSAAVGAIIGKGGETMRSLKSESGCRLQMSKNQEVYHGTNERICLVKGKIVSVLKVLDVMMEKIREKVDPNTPADVFDHKGVDRTKEMKLLVPNTSAGMVIGKSGARIKEIRDQTGANIQVYPKAGSQEAKVSLERVITVAAEEPDVLLNAIERVLEKVAADPQHASTTLDQHGKDLVMDNSFGASGGHNPHNLHHSQNQASTNQLQHFDFTNRQSNNPNAPPTSSLSFSSMQQTQFANLNQAPGAQVWQPTQQRLLDANYGTPTKDMYSNGSANSFKFNPMQGLGNQELLAFLDSLQSTLRTSGFNEASVAEVMQAMQVLAKYNIMGLGLGLGVAAMAQMRSNEPNQMSAPPQQQTQPLMQQSRYDGGNMGGVGGSGLGGPSSLMDSGDRHYSQHNEANKFEMQEANVFCFQSIGGVGGVLIDVMSQSKANANNSNAPNFAATVIKEKLVDNGHVELEVPDAIVGAVLGPKAKTLAEIQHLSGCKVEVHKRGVIAGQGNRLIRFLFFSLTGEAECI
ncbi:unnamed protein product, partial [Anisakis simplex]|uniref:RNA-binding protein Nova-1 n=1 Tax=Anisakis simplex TaxID=6269 RepID=A0A0M3K833_ANISI